MIFTNFLALAGLTVSLATASPTPAEHSLLESRGTRANCTSYYSDYTGTLCLDRPSDCSATYTVQSGDTCYSIANKFGNLTSSILYYWNPDVGRSCLALAGGAPICIKTPWYSFPGPPVQKQYGSVVDAKELGATEQPVPLNYATWENCTKYELAGGGFYFDNMVRGNGISRADFCTWNPNVDCASANPLTLANYWYAVGC